MSREIKFRLWDNAHKQFVPNHVWSLLNNPAQVAVCRTAWRDVEVGEIWYPFHCELDQYTGLQDGTGSDIYEGDILRYEVDGATPYAPKQERIGRVVFVDGEFTIDAGRALYDSLLPFMDRDGEIIGNVHMDPELLTETDQP